MKEPKRPSRNSEFGQWMNDVMDWVRSGFVQTSPTVKATRTTRGTFLRAIGGKGKPGEDAQIQFRGQHNPETDYVEGDRVIDGDESADGKVAHDDGTWAGTWICIADIAGDPGNDHPADDPTHWQMEANGKHALRVYRKTGQDQDILIDSGRDSAGNLWIKVRKDKDAENAGSILLDVTALLTIATDESLPAGEELIIKPRLTEGRDESTGDCKKCILLRGEWYTP